MRTVIRLSVVIDCVHVVAVPDWYTFFCKMGPCTVFGKGREVYFVGCKQWQRRETKKTIALVIFSGALFFSAGPSPHAAISPLICVLASGGVCNSRSCSPNLFIVDSHFKFYFHVASGC